MALQNWGWIIRGLRGVVNLLKELRQMGAPINTTHLTELRQCSKELTEIAESADRLNQDEDQGAKGSTLEFLATDNDRDERQRES